MYGIEYGDILIYREPTGDADPGTTTVHWVKLERGTLATDYTAAPEDGEAALEQKLSSVRAQISNEGDSIRQEVQATIPATTMSALSASSA